MRQTMKSIEIELRYKVLDEQELTLFIQLLTFIHTKQVLDIYLDASDVRIYKQGIYILGNCRLARAVASV